MAPMHNTETVGNLISTRAAELGEKAFLICDDDVLTYAAAERESLMLAAQLLRVGVEARTHVGLLYPNGRQFVVGWLAITRLGAVSLPLSTFSTPRELQDLLRRADVEVLLAASSYRNRDYVRDLTEIVDTSGDEYGRIRDLRIPRLRRIEFDIDATARPMTDSDHAFLAAIEATVRPSERLTIVHTSGSTSAPKGVIHRHGSLVRHIRNLNELRRLEHDDVLFSNSPFFWIGGLAYSLLGTLVAGATLVCSNSQNPTEVLDLLERTRPTMTNGFAASVAHLENDPTFASRDLSSIRRGNLWPIMPPETRPRDPELRHNMLGMTETGSVCLASADDSDQPESRRGSFGRPVPGLEARIIDLDTGSECDTGTTGELWLRGTPLMEGYYGRPRELTFTPDGWFPTGDLFHVDSDGFYYFDGRSGDMIKTSGANVSPREVESAIEHVSGLRAHVIGLDHPERGQVVAAAVVVADQDSGRDPDGMKRALRSELSAYKVPRVIAFVRESEIPLLSSGKIDPAGLRRLLAQATS